MIGLSMRKLSQSLSAEVERLAEARREARAETLSTAEWWSAKAHVLSEQLATSSAEVERQRKLVELAELSATAHRCYASAANALLDHAADEAIDEASWPVLVKAIRAHLAGQPATAPEMTEAQYFEVYETMLRPGENERQARTAAEQAVLDALEEALTRLGDDPPYYECDADMCGDLARLNPALVDALNNFTAELTRRGLK